MSRTAERAHLLNRGTKGKIGQKSKKKSPVAAQNYLTGKTDIKKKRGNMGGKHQREKESNPRGQNDLSWRKKLGTQPKGEGTPGKTGFSKKGSGGIFRCKITKRQIEKAPKWGKTRPNLGHHIVTWPLTTSLRAKRLKQKESRGSFS